MTRPRVLLVDDDKDMLECLELALSEELETTSAPGGREALRLLRTTPFAAVVLDLMMPEVDGLEVLATLRAEGIRVPVLIASARPDAEVTARASGAAGFISKPYALDELTRKLREIVRPRAVERTSRPRSVTRPDDA